jgi:hypothetical protein
MNGAQSPITSTVLLRIIHQPFAAFCTSPKPRLLLYKSTPPRYAALQGSFLVRIAAKHWRSLIAIICSIFILAVSRKGDSSLLLVVISPSINGPIPLFGPFH